MAEATNPAPASGSTPGDAVNYDTTIPKFENFDDMELSRELLRGVYSNGFEYPSPIQQRAIVPIIKGGDVIAQAPSGTGKTGAFTVGVLQRIDASLPHCQALILSPVRELALQTESVVSNIGRFLLPQGSDRKLTHPFIGGTMLMQDVRVAQSGVVVAVGTPGRVGDLVERGALRIDQLKLIVLDEADDLMSRGFQDQISDLFKYLPREVQVCLFSATMPDNVLVLSDTFMRNPTRILVKKEELTLDGIKQFWVEVEDVNKAQTLCDLYKHASVAQSVIFCNSRRRVDWLEGKMKELGHQVAAVHADMDRSVRSRVVEDFKAGTTRVLISTDLLARGIDVQHVNIVINFDIPRDLDEYIHRIGRGGRWGRKGVGINLVTQADHEQLRAIENHYKVEIAQLPADFSKFLDS